MPSDASRLQRRCTFFCTLEKSCWKGQNQHCFGSVCHLSTVALGDKNQINNCHTQKMTSKEKGSAKKTPVSCPHANSKAEFSIFSRLRAFERPNRINKATFVQNVSAHVWTRPRRTPESSSGGSGRALPPQICPAVVEI